MAKSKKLDTASPTVTALVREWKIVRAKMTLDLLHVEDPHDNKSRDTIVLQAFNRQAEIERQLGQMLPSNADEIANMIDVVRGILESGIPYDASRYDNILGSIRTGAFRLLDPKRTFEKARQQAEDHRSNAA
jgi:hypothetical protein